MWLYVLDFLSIYADGSKSSKPHPKRKARADHFCIYIYEFNIIRLMIMILTDKFDGYEI